MLTKRYWFIYKHFNGLDFFFGLIGDYASLLILSEYELNFCPSMDPASIVLYLKWRTGVAGSKLVDARGNPVLDIDGQPVHCVGTWQAPVNVEQCRSAITCAHNARNQSGAYFEPCNDCIALDNAHQYSGCRFHRGSPHLWSKGNPRDSQVFTNWLKSYAKEKSGYIPKGDTPLQPHQLLKIRAYLLSSNSIWDFQIYVMILISCRMFLREDELANMKFEDINADITTVKAGGRLTL